MRVVTLPKGWASSTLESVISDDGLISDGDWIESKDQDPNGSIRLIQLADIGDGDFRNKSERFMRFEQSEALNCTYLNKGDVLVARMPDPLGRACIFPGIEQQSVTVVDICLIRATTNSGITNKTLCYWINSPEFRSLIAANSSGTTRKRITRKKLEKFYIPIPPLAEQKEIAARLDNLLAQVDSIKNRLDSIPTILKRFRQSVLAVAVSGKLTEEWRDSASVVNPLEQIHEFKEKLISSGGIKKSKQNNPLPFDDESEVLGAIPSSWKWARLISISTLVTDGKHGNCIDEDESGLYFLSAKDVKNGKLRYDGSRQINEVEFNEVHQRTDLEPGDICIVNTGATVGKLAIAEDNPLTKRTTFQKSVAVIKLIRPLINEKFVAFYLMDSNKRLMTSSSGSAVNNLLLSTMKQVPVPVAPVEEQTEIVRRVEQLFIFADQIEQRVKDAQSRVNNLTQSILAKAFRGELTADWREQNPDLISGENAAEALLARIKAEREVLESTKKAFKRKKAKV